MKEFHLHKLVYEIADRKMKNLTRKFCKKREEFPPILPSLTKDICYLDEHKIRKDYYYYWSHVKLNENKCKKLE